LVLKDNTDESETLFKIRKDTYRPPNHKKRHLETGLAGDPVNPHDMVIIETFTGSYIHISEVI
jgi:hypothetical protein